MSSRGFGLGAIGRVYHVAQEVAKKKYPLQILTITWIILIGGYMIFLFGQTRNDNWYMEFIIVGLSEVVAFFLFLIASLYEPRADNLNDAVKYEKTLRLPPDKQPIVLQMKRSLEELTTDQKATKEDITQVQVEIRKVLSSLDLKKDESTTIVTKKELRDQVNKDLNKATARLYTDKKRVSSDREKLLKELEDIESKP